MLNGVGGCTVEQAKWNVSIPEARAWSAYLLKHGSLHTGRRIERMLAILISQISHALGGSTKPSDLMHQDLTDPPEATPEEVMAILGFRVGKPEDFKPVKR